MITRAGWSRIHQMSIAMQKETDPQCLDNAERELHLICGAEPEGMGAHLPATIMQKRIKKLTLRVNWAEVYIAHLEHCGDCALIGECEQGNQLKEAWQEAKAKEQG